RRKHELGRGTFDDLAVTIACDGDELQVALSVTRVSRELCSSGVGLTYDIDRSRLRHESRQCREHTFGGARSGVGLEDVAGPSRPPFERDFDVRAAGCDFV